MGLWFMWRKRYWRLEHLKKPDFYLNSGCIKKYFNSTIQEYYDIEKKNFKWPKMAHGTYNPEHKFYNIIVERCKENTVKLI